MCSIPTQSQHVLLILNVNAERNAAFVRLMAQFGSRQWLLCHPPECLAIGYGDLWFSCSVKANMSEWICDRHRDLKRFILIGHGFDLKSCDWIRRYWGALIAWGGVIYVPFGWKFFFSPMLCFYAHVRVMDLLLINCVEIWARRGLFFNSRFGIVSLSGHYTLHCCSAVGDFA